MKSIIITKEELKQQLLPFVYDNAMIFDTNFKLGDREYVGIYGLKDNTLFFISYENLDDQIELDIPTSIEELESFIIGASFMIQRLALNYKFISLPDNIFINSEINNYKNASEIFANFIQNYEKNMVCLGVRKHGC